MDGHFVPEPLDRPAGRRSPAAPHRPLPRLPPDDRQPRRPPRRLRRGRRRLAAPCTSSSATPGPLFERMRALGMRVGLVLNPETPLDAVLPYLEEIDILLFMSVHPGLRRPGVHPRGARQAARSAREIVDERGLAVELEIDGGINLATAPLAATAGADILVAGSAIFHADDPLAAARGDPRRGLADASAPERLARARARCSPSPTAWPRGSREDKSGARAGRPAHRRPASRSPSTAVSADGVDAVADALRDDDRRVRRASSSPPAAPASAPATSRPRATPRGDRARGARAGRGDPPGQRRRRPRLRDAVPGGVRHARARR